jgi:exodeoxyribonuclease III
MKIATFNANSIRTRQGIILDWLARTGTDILCVQETKVQDHLFPVEDFEKAGYHCCFKGQKSYNGVAIISKEPIENVSFGFDDEPADESRIIRAEIANMHIVNTYVPQGRDVSSEHYFYKLEWFNRLGRLFQKDYKPGDAVMWMGDLNVAPTEIDVHDPVRLLGHVCFNPEVSEALKSVTDWGFVDLFRQHNPGPGHFTFWDYRMRNTVQKNLGWRIDHIFGTEKAASRCKGCEIDIEPRKLERPSDHTFLSAVLG